VAARDNGLAFGSFGGDLLAAGSPGFPIWQLYFSPQLPSSVLLRELRTSGYEYLVVDTRMYHFLPQVGVYFTAGEPGDGTHIPPLSALRKFRGLPWLSEVYGTNHLRIYRIDLSQLDACPSAPVLAATLLPGCGDTR
jgi:hypothetical protein